MPTLLAAGRHDLADNEWNMLESLLPRGSGGTAAEVEQAAADQRDPLADPGRVAVAGRPAGVRALAVGVRAVPPLAAERHLETIWPRCRPWPTRPGT